MEMMPFAPEDFFFFLGGGGGGNLVSIERYNHTGKLNFPPLLELHSVKHKNEAARPHFPNLEEFFPLTIS